MKYTYHIYESTELIAATFELDEPLPHIEVGHQLLLATDTYSGKTGTALVIEYVRIVMTARKNNIRNFEVHVFCKEQKRPPPM